MKLYQALASSLQAELNCARTNNNEWLYRHCERTDRMIANLMPSGSGWDNGTAIERSSSYGDKFVFRGSFHHMDQNGSYDGWTDHTIIVSPSFVNELNIRITGRNRNDIKEYLHEIFFDALTQDVSTYMASERERYKLGMVKPVLTPQQKWLQNAFRFFFKNAGYCVGRRAEGAFQLAKAERWAEENNYTFEFDADDSADLGDHEYWCSDARRVKAGYAPNGEHVGERNAERFYNCEHFAYVCFMKDKDGTIVQSLGGILDPDDNCMRVTKAELALEQMPTKIA
jgi:hypothetical protein